MGEKFAVTVLLENPVGENFLTFEELVQEVSGPVTGAQWWKVRWSSRPVFGKVSSSMARELILPPSLSCCAGNYTDEGVHQTQDPLLREEE